MSTPKRWNRGIGATTQRERLGFNEADQKQALYECKVAQYAQQAGTCGRCAANLDPKWAVWICSNWLKGGGLAEWAMGRHSVWNPQTLGFDSILRSPDEIRTEYGNGTRGHALWCRKCKHRWQHYGPGLHSKGPAFEREYQAAVEAGHDPTSAGALALEVLQNQARERMAEARTHKKHQQREFEEVSVAGRSRRKGRKRGRVQRERKVYALGESPMADRWLAEARAEADAIPESDMERQIRETIEGLMSK